jgi:hypothetical protein
MKEAAIAILLCCAAIPAQADLLVAPHTKGTLEVEYSYDSSGQTKDLYDVHEWHVKRVVKITAQLAAGAVSPMPVMIALDAKQQADLQASQTRTMASAAQAQQKMAPMMGDIQAIVDKCGEDEACIEKAVASYGMSQGMTPEMESAKHDVADAAEASKPGAPRYQVWSATAQKGTYSIEEKVHLVDSDPICMEVPGGRCTIDTTGQGSGDTPAAPTPEAAAGISAIEVDSVGKTLMLRLPVPIGVLTYRETTTSDHPEHKTGVTTESIRFPPEVKPVTASIKGDLRNQSGEQTIKLSGKAEDGGTLTVRWHFSAQ